MNKNIGSTLDSEQFPHFQARFHTLLKYTNNLVICLTPDLCITEFNNIAEQIYGWRKQDVLNRNFVELCLSSGFAKPIPFDITRTLSKQDSINYESTILQPGDKKHFIRWSITPLVNENQKLNGLIMVGHDLTALKQAQNTLHYLDGIIKYAPNLIYWKDRHSVHLGCNDRFAEFAGLPSREFIVGKTDYDFAWASQADSYRSDDREVIESGDPKTNIEDLMPKANGELAVVISNKVPLRDLDGNIIGILGSATDITKRKKEERVLFEAKEEAELANQAKSNFLATMSHELRTPMNAIMGMAQVIKNEDLPESQAELIDIIFQAGKNLLTLIEDILDFAQLEVGKLKINVTSFDLHALIREATTSIQHQIDPATTKLELNFDSNKSLELRSDPTRIRQIIINLLGNAIKFTKEGYIKIKITHDKPSVPNACVYITVEDTGIGIPKDKLNQIFERFTQVESAYTRKFEGAGLGLAICKQLVTNMGGAIHAESVLGKGSCFCVTLPLDITEKKIEQNELASQN